MNLREGFTRLSMVLGLSASIGILIIHLLLGSFDPKILVLMLIAFSAVFIPLIIFFNLMIFIIEGFKKS